MMALGGFDVAYVTVYLTLLLVSDKWFCSASDHSLSLFTGGSTSDSHSPLELSYLKSRIEEIPETGPPLKQLQKNYKTFDDFKKSLHKSCQPILRLNPWFIEEYGQSLDAEMVIDENTSKPRLRIAKKDIDIAHLNYPYRAYCKQGNRKTSTEVRYNHFRIDGDLVYLKNLNGQEQAFRFGTTLKGLKLIMNKRDPFRNLANRVKQRNLIIRYAREDTKNGVYMIFYEDYKRPATEISNEEFVIDGKKMGYYKFKIKDSDLGYKDAVAQTVIIKHSIYLVWSFHLERYRLHNWGPKQETAFHNSKDIFESLKDDK